MQIPARLKSFLSDSMIYTLVNLGNKAIPFLLLPIIIRLVSPTEYGIYALFLTTETLLMPLVSLNVHSALGRHFFLDDIDLRAYVSTILIFLTIFVAVLCGITYILPDTWVAWTGLSSRLLTMAVFTAFGGSIALLVAVLFRSERKPLFYGVYIIVQSVLLLSCVLLFSYWEPNAEMLIMGRSIAFAVFLLGSLGIFWYKNLLSSLFSQLWLERILRFSLPTILFSVATFVFVSSDRFQIGYFMGKQAVGYYSAITQVAALISVLAASFNAAWLPWIFENLKKKETATNLFIVKLSYALMAGFIILGLVFALLLPFLSKYILTPDYQTYIYVGYPLILGFVLQGLYFVICPYLWFTEQTKYLGYGGIGIAILNITLNFFLIPHFGILGASLSNAASWATLFVYTFYQSQRVYPMPWLISASSVQ